MNLLSDKDPLKEYETWIIAYSPRGDAFFTTRNRSLFWESETEFETKQEAIGYFRNNVEYFIGIKNEILTKCIPSYKPEDKVWLADTGEYYYG